MTDKGKEITSSQELGGQLGISSAQIRKDLSQFGEFGKQGTGYNIEFLVDQLKRILKVERVWDVALIGAGDLGNAIAHYGGFIDRGYLITAIYDNDPAKIGQTTGRFTIRGTENLTDEIREQQIKIAMLAVPARVAQEVSDQLVEAGVEAILCYAPISLFVPEQIRVEYIDPVLHLQHMTYYLS
jgi:redox-sensing transcriptional repressor